MIEVFKNSKTPKIRMKHDSALTEEVGDVLRYLSGQENYAITGENAVNMHIGDSSYKLPFEVVGDVEYPGGIVPITPTLFSPEAIIRDAQNVDVPHWDSHYKVWVAKPERLVSILFAENIRYGRGGVQLISHFNKDLNFEDIRCAWKGHPDYDKLYSRMCEAFYELVDK